VITFDVDAIVAGATAENTSSALYLEIKEGGTPMVQQRPHVRCLPYAGRPIIYDPSQSSKRAYDKQAAIKLALTQLGIANFPVFPHRNNLKLKVLRVTFYLHKNEAKDVLDICLNLRWMPCGVRCLSKR
jgi:hypothetical protein